jgi:hypothetical protein
MGLFSGWVNNIVVHLVIGGLIYGVQYLHHVIYLFKSCIFWCY